MKSMNSNNNWLGFSLSPHMSMEASAEPHHHPNQQAHRHNHHPPPTTAPVPSSVQSGFFLSPHLNTPNICYEGGNGGGFYSQLSVMPLKSDGSLHIMEALTRSQQQGMVPSPSPKLEDFLGGCGPSMGSHDQYGNNDREAMALSLDSMYYQQNPEPDQGSRNHPLDLLQQPFRHHHPYFHQLQEGMCSGLPGHVMYQAQVEDEAMTEDGFPSLMKNWAARQYNVGEENHGIGAAPVSAMGYGDLQSLSLSMSPGSQSSCVTAPQQIPPAAATECIALDGTKKRGAGKGSLKQTVHRKSIDTFGQRTSQYRGVTRHRWTGRYEAHLWDNSCKKEGQTRKGRQVYLGGYDMEDKAARAYDLAALKYWGPSTHINFPLGNYCEELEEMKNMSRQEYVAHLRRKSSGFSRGASIYRGVTRHHQHGRWQARIGRVAGNKDLYLGTFSTQEEAAEAYDVAAIKFRGVNAVTNFEVTRYDVERIMVSNTLLSGDQARRNKAVEAAINVPLIQGCSREVDKSEDNNSSGSDWKMVLFQSPQEAMPDSESLDQKAMTESSDQRSMSFSAALHGLVGVDTISIAQAPADHDSVKPGNTHLSNASSLVTSLSSSREGSPDRAGVPMLYAKSPPRFITQNPMGSWIPSRQAIPMAHLPLFAAWSDA